ncbi:hypothetical protein SOCE26_050490 [Sorangium cellulosum]|uniref:FAD-binding domain-containing protein n=1 Tax=Sorangium cellulosum TaxID=56 RepID=A0A2L0EWG5_SORCE|nr:FAD-dependent monooxygenase [Sorangium cellulosum]AUX43599.1 hypothetical protein SOCE26_050490 [Sorangium cellulosum]
MQPALGHAIVVGGSMAGLVVARTLKEHFARVTVVERDHYPSEPTPRRGVPQSRHIHIVLTRGRQELERLFPDLGADLEKDGAITFDYGRGATLFFRGGALAPFDSQLVVRACTRPLLDHHIRRYLAASGVSFLEGRRVVGLTPSEDGGAVTGVLLQQDGGAGERLAGDLVVDACGRGSRAAAWLKELGFEAPAETVIDSALSYTCQLYTPRPDFSPSWNLLSTMPRAPHQPRSGAIFRVEGNRWFVCFATMGDDEPPGDEASFRAFARTLPSPALFEALSQAEPVGPVNRSGSTENRLRHYERLSRFPGGFVLVGDSVCALNPIYGQGITSAALGALALGAELARHRRARPGGDLRDFGRRFQKRLAKLNEETWRLAVGGDAAWPQTRGLDQAGILGKFLVGWPGSLFRSYGDLVVEAAAHQPDVARVMMEVMHMVRPSGAILTPGMMARVLAHRFGAGHKLPPAVERSPADPGAREA